MKEIIFSQIGLWSIFMVKMIKLSGDKDKIYPLDKNDA